MCLREDLDQKSSPRSNWAVWEYTRKSCARVVPRPLGDVPVGAYDSTRLSNIGIGHGAIDAGVGYTYLNPQTGHEFSGVLGFTYNFTNQSTQSSRRARPRWRRSRRVGGGSSSKIGKSAFGG